ncbi:proteasome subunit alpha type-7-1B isoform X1 [Drosophila takahashii]|uniref:proteasome subunit alpha type-7-1B isoform X1 n=1 Tax=Drosophila takahashii TaxID=29030 RepID=UPI00389944DC
MAERYDRAVTIYSPDGHLLQVEYAQEAVRRGSTVVGLRTSNAIVLGVEKRSVGDLQEERVVRKICMLDDHVALTFSGLTADARILVNRAQMESQSHRLNFEKPVSVEYITRVSSFTFGSPGYHIGRQKFTTSTYFLNQVLYSNVGFRGLRL